MISALTIKIEQREGKSFLKDAYVTQPFRIVPVGQYRRDKAAYLMIMSSSPGLLDQDDHDIQVQLAENTTLQLQTQAYQRLYNMKTGARQQTTLRMEAGSAFSYVPHPVVPQAAAHFESINRIHMTRNCRVLWSEIVTCGRKMSGEAFAYQHFQTLTELFVDDKLLVKDNVLLQPESMPVGGLGMFEGYTHQGALLYYHTCSEAVAQWIDHFQESYQDEKELLFGISALPGHGFMLRVLGMGAEQLYRIFQEIQETLWATEFIKEKNKL